MVSDQEIANGVETVLRQSDPNAVTSLSSVVHQLEAKLGLDLSDKADFIRDQITYLLRSHPVSKDQLAPQAQLQFQAGFAPQPHFGHFQQSNNAVNPYGQALQTHAPPALLPQNVVVGASETSKGRAPTVTKRRGGPGGLNKVCGVSPKLQVIVGEPALPRTEIVKQLWAYIRKHNLQDPGNKRKIICDEALRSLFETDCTDMFKMNKLLAKHILPLDPSKQSADAKKPKAEDDSAKNIADAGHQSETISDELAKFFGTEEKEMLHYVAMERVWDYIKANNLEDPLSSMVIHCDEKLQELLGCESISALGIQEMITRSHLTKG